MSEHDVTKHGDQLFRNRFENAEPEYVLANFSLHKASRVEGITVGASLRCCSRQ